MMEVGKKYRAAGQPDMEILFISPEGNLFLRNLSNEREDVYWNESAQDFNKYWTEIKEPIVGWVVVWVDSREFENRVFETEQNALFFIADQACEAVAGKVIRIEHNG